MKAEFWREPLPRPLYIVAWVGGRRYVAGYRDGLPFAYRSSIVDTDGGWSLAIEVYGFIAYIGY